MGVHGLWKLLEAAGKPVPLETLENKVLAVDVSIWLHQMMKGFQDSRGAPVPNAHLLGLFHRVCKLLFYRIKPVFVFDGGVPLLKKQTIAARKNLKKQASQNAAEARDKLLKNLVKRKAVRQLLQGPKASGEVNIDTSKQDDIFHLPPMPEESVNSDSEDEPQDRLAISMESDGFNSDSEPETKPIIQQLHGCKMDLHSLDVHSEEFLSLPPDVRHDILSELKETRKQNSWGRIHEMPEESGDFSCYQLGRLLKRRSVQVSLENAEKEMGGKVMRINELQELMEAQGVNIIEEHGFMDSASKRIASNSATRYVLCKEPSGSHTSGSSQTSNNEVEKNPLYDEQVEFIAQMAENMLQQLHKKDGKHLHIDKETKHVPKEALVKEEPILFDDTDEKRHQVLADSWSSDEDVTDEKEPWKTSSQASNKEKSSTEVFKLTAYKRKADDSLASCSAPKSPKEDFGDSHISDESPASYRFQNSVCSSSEDLTSEATGDFEPSSRVDLITVPSVETKDSRVGNPINTAENSLNDTKDCEIVGSGKESDSCIIKSKASKQEKNKSLAEIIGNADVDVSQSCSTKSQAASGDHITGRKKTIEVVINPGQKPEDDLFSDIFTGEYSESPKGIQGTSQLKQKEPLEIVIHPSIKPANDDIFADIFENYEEKDILEPLKMEVLSESDSESLSKCSPSDEVSSNGKVRSATNPVFNKRTEDTIGKETGTGVTDAVAIKSVPNKSPLHDIDARKNLNSPESVSLISSILSSASTSTSNLNQVEASLEAEQLNLQKERGRQERLAASITDQMCIEAQELLQLFGLPYVVAPMEAEAQCAFLDKISLTEGSITDDSDIWLFGGKKVYKNFFNQKKHVLQFTSSNISHYFKLSREQLIQLALLVGSDYTCGIQGVGPVTALEIVAAFHTNAETDPVQSTMKSLSKFKDWWTSGRPHQSNRLRLLDKKLKNVNFSEGFPSKAVIEAYLHPSVEDSQETFSWGTLDLPALREYARSKFGWPISKTDEIILPVSKRWTARNSQRSIDSYFNFQPHLVEGLNKMSKRVQKAVNLMEKDVDSDNIDDPDPITPTASRKRQHKKSVAASNSETAVKRQKRNVQLSSDSELDNEVTKAVARTKDAEDRPLPVRAPTVPRERSSTGVKRMGRKPVSVEANKETNEIAKADIIRDSEKGAHQMILESREDPLGDSGTELQGQVVQKGSRSRKTKKQVKEDAIKAPTSTQHGSLKCVPKVGFKSTSMAKSSDTGKTKIALKKTRKVPKVTCSDYPDCMNQLDPEDKEGLLTQASTKKQEIQEKKSLAQDDILDVPSCSFSKDQIDNVDEPFSEDLNALSEMNWEEDPWSLQEAGPSTSKEPRPKLFFGGIRANKPKKQVRRAQVSSVEAHDTRGVRPGWVTRERMESRTAWIESIHSKKVEAIPQRQQDQRAMEEAKMKAISVVKATEARQASRLLGRNVSKRGKGKKRPAGKILPEHNLSESSSDE